MRDRRFAEFRDWDRNNRAAPSELDEARAEARLIAEGPTNTDLLYKQRDTLAASVWRIFHDEFVTAARETPERQLSWARALEVTFEKQRIAITSAAMLIREEQDVRGAVDLWQEERDPFSVWDHLSEVHLFERDIDYWSELLIRVHPERGLLAMETIPYPALMSEILTARVREDRDLIEALICAAPVVFDDFGAWTPTRCVSALFVAALVTEHARELRDTLSYAISTYDNEDERREAERSLCDLEQRELPQWMRHAFGLVFARSDGQQIALGYLGHLSRESLLGRGLHHGDKDRWSATTAALAALTATLKHGAVGIKQLREAWQDAERIAKDKDEAAAARNRVRQRRSSGRKRDQEGEGARNLRAEGLPLLYGAATLLEAPSTSEAELVLFWSWFEELLEGRDPGLSLVNHGTSLWDVPQRIGVLLSRLPDPGARLRETYTKLEPQRRRALFAHRYEDIYHDLESIILLRTGLNAAVISIDGRMDGARADAARGIFFWIYSAARRLWLTAVLDQAATKEDLVAVCFAFMPFLFGDTLEAALKLVIPPLATDACVLSKGCTNLLLNGVDASKLLAFVTGAGADLEAALQDAWQWSILTGRKEVFPEHLRRLASELSITINTPRDG
jgi:hypothetical protein